MGKTHRNYGKLKHSYQKDWEYGKRDFRKEQIIYDILPIYRSYEKPWNQEKFKEQIEEDPDFLLDRRQDGESIYSKIPRNLIWAIENNLEKGLQELADYLGLRVLFEYRAMSNYINRKNMTTNYGPVGYGGGQVRTYNYSRGLPATKIFEAEEEAILNQDILEIDTSEKEKYYGVLVCLNIPEDHYLKRAEYRKTGSGPCLGCFYSAGRIHWLKGAGNKANGKNKGQRRDRQREMTKNNLCLN